MIVFNFCMLCKHENALALSKIIKINKKEEDCKYFSISFHCSLLSLCSRDLSPHLKFLFSILF